MSLIQQKKSEHHCYGMPVIRPEWTELLWHASDVAKMSTVTMTCLWCDLNKGCCYGKHMMSPKWTLLLCKHVMSRNWTLLLCKHVMSPNWTLLLCKHMMSPNWTLLLCKHVMSPNWTLLLCKHVMSTKWTPLLWQPSDVTKMRIIVSILHLQLYHQCLNTRPIKYNSN